MEAVVKELNRDGGWDIDDFAVRTQIGDDDGADEAMENELELSVEDVDASDNSPASEASSSDYSSHSSMAHKENFGKKCRGRNQKMTVSVPFSDSSSGDE